MFIAICAKDRLLTSSVRRPQSVNGPLLIFYPGIPWAADKARCVTKSPSSGQRENEEVERCGALDPVEQCKRQKHESSYS